MGRKSLVIQWLTLVDRGKAWRRTITRVPTYPQELWPGYRTIGRVRWAEIKFPHLNTCRGKSVAPIQVP